MKLRFIFALIVTSFYLTAWADANTSAANLDESRKTAQELTQKISDTLKQKISTDGLEAAMEVCKTLAPALAEEYAKNGLTVRRVSAKPRNKARATPDEWETRMLERTDLALHNGMAPSTIEFSETQDEKDGRWFRYFKAIPVQPMCLQCHGQPYQIPDNIKARLSADYPDDQATGYSAGAIIGGVSVKRKLN